MWDTAGKQGWTNKQYSFMTSMHVDLSGGWPVRTYISFVWILIVVWRTCQKQWMLGIDGERVSVWQCWHKVDFLNVGFEFSFPFLGVVAIPKLKNSVCPYHLPIVEKGTDGFRSWVLRLQFWSSVECGCHHFNAITPRSTLTTGMHSTC